MKILDKWVCEWIDEPYFERILQRFFAACDYNICKNVTFKANGKDFSYTVACLYHGEYREYFHAELWA